jgi:hypothetical protein
MNAMTEPTFTPAQIRKAARVVVSTMSEARRRKAAGERIFVQSRQYTQPGRGIAVCIEYFVCPQRALDQA